MQEFEYQRVPISIPESLAISSQEAILDQGWRVQIEPKQKHLIPFNITKMESAPWNRTLLFLLAFFALCIAGILGALFLRFYAEPNIYKYLNYPSANCTIVSYETSTDRRGTLYKLQVAYFDSRSTEHHQNVTVTEDEVNAKNWTVGSIFLCVYQGDFLEPYDNIHSEYVQLSKLWFMGIVVPVGVFLLFSLPTILRVLLVERNSTIRYYPRSISYIDDLELVITDWADLGSDLRQFFYLLLLTYYSNGYPSNRQIAFEETTTYKRTAFTFVMSLFFVFLIGFSPLVLIGIGIYEMRGYYYVSYISGLVLFSVGTSLLPLSFYVIHKYFWAQKMSIITEELWIQYSVNGNTMKGWVALKVK